ncbi:unnamed protein product [Echinostoma caproni]|uniref:Uncharacterized protein n=1 Tax=Echinostoma caproni TaxID=27848 RepID=A0A183AW01_9TREM|nr:unnamed protein product [Echinostoma caproni]
MHQTVLMKHGYLLRWKRFCSSTAAVEAIHGDYLKRLEHLTAEYLDSSSRAHRLASTREGILANSDNGVEDVTVDDYMIYLRYLICHLQSLTYANQLLNLIACTLDIGPQPQQKQYPCMLGDESLSGTPKDGFDPNTGPDSIRGESSKSGGVPMRTRSRSYSGAEDDVNLQGQSEQTRTINKTSSDRQDSIAPGSSTTAPPQITETVISPVDTRARDFVPEGMDSVVEDTATLTTNIQAIRSSADEMELFSVINRKFRHIFNRQEEMRTFKTYDNSRSGAERWGLESWTRAVKKPSNWLPYVRLRPKRNEYLVRIIMELRCKTMVDDLLKAAANFLMIKSPEHPPMIHAASVVSHRQGQSTADIFKKIYTNPELYGQ